MSVMMLCPAHFDYLVSFAVKVELRYYSRAERSTEVVTALVADATGRMLVSANADSFAARYTSASAATERARYFATARDYTARPIAGPFEPVQVLKAIACLSYQACEAPGWEESDAKSFCDAARERACEMLAGYDAAKWGIEDAADVRPAAPAQAPAPARALAPALRPLRLASPVPAFKPPAPAAPFWGQGDLL